MLSSILDTIFRKVIGFKTISGTIISGAGKNITVGKHVTFGGNVFLFGTADITIGDYTMIAYGVTIHTSTHDYKDHPMMTKRIDRPVKIGSHVWIGTGAIILPGVIVEDYAVIGAGSVVTANVKQGSVVVGNPARILKHRDKKWYLKPMTIKTSAESKITNEGYLTKYCR